MARRTKIIDLIGVGVLGLFSACLSVSAEVNQSSFTKPSAAQADIELANRYIGTFTSDQKLYIFPSAGRLFNIVGVSERVGDALERYARLSPTKVSLYPARRGSSVTIVASDDFYRMDINQKKSIINDGKQVEFYRNKIAETDLSPDGCTIRHFEARDMWAASGFIILDLREPTFSTEAGLDRCIFLGLDIINGFPTLSPAPDLGSLPEFSVRSVIMSAILDCAAAGDSDLHKSEQSRDGLTARPSMSCVKDAISRWENE